METITNYQPGASKEKPEINCEEGGELIKVHEHRNTMSMYGRRPSDGPDDGEQRVFYNVCDKCFPAMSALVVAKT